MAFEDYDVKRAFMRIEDELIASMMRNLGRHLKEEQDEGFDWSQWQVEQLKYLQEYRRRNRKVYGPRFKDINEKIEEAILDAHQNGQKDEELNILDAISRDKHIRPRYQNPSQPAVEAAGDAFFRVNDRKLEALVEAAHSDLQKAEHAVLRRVDDQYRKIIFDAQMYANTGAGTIQKAVDMATKDFLAKGIDSIEYKNGTRHTISDYADMYIRTAERRAYLMGEGKKRQEWGEQLVIVNRRGKMTAGNYGHACPKCIPWLGKILIDDVYSGGKPDGKHELLSDAMAAGFLHPRCRDGFTTYFPGISPQEDPVTKKEVKEAVKVEKEEAEGQNAERQEERFERLAENSLDQENQKKYEARRKAWYEKHTGRTEEREKALIENINRQGTDSLLGAYDRRREHYNLNLTPAEQLRDMPLNNVTADYTGVSPETAEAFNSTISDLSEEYLSGITQVKVANPKETFGTNFFARTQHHNEVGQKILVINPHKCKDLQKMTERIRELSNKGHCVLIPEGMEAQYVATHEFAHGLLDMKVGRKSFIGMNWSSTNKVRKEINTLYSEYMDEIRSIEAEIEELKKSPIMRDFNADPADQMEAFKRLKEAQDRLNDIRISKYSMENADEFMAEAFTQNRIGINQSKYSDRVMDVLDREYLEILDQEYSIDVRRTSEVPSKKYATSLIDEIFNTEEESIKWPKRGERMGRKKAKELRDYGKRKGIDLAGLADYDLPEASAKEIVDDAEKFLRDFPELNDGRPRISFTAAYMNSSRTFAGTTNHLISVSADAFRDLGRLEEEYQKLVAKHWFPQGTDHHALIAHEIGHVIHHHYPEINPIEIAMALSGKHTITGLMEYINENLSEYASSYADGREIISECYACALTGVNNDFALKFVAECHKIIEKRRREVF